MIKKILKITIPIVLVIVAVVLLCFNVFTPKTNITYNGKGSCEITVEDYEGEEGFETYVQKTLKEYNAISGDDDIWKLDSIKSSNVDDGAGNLKNVYTVKVNFRRIDKAKGPGDFYWQNYSSFLNEGSQTLTLLQNLRDGNWKNTWISTINGKQASIYIDKTKKNEQKFKVKDIDGNIQNTIDEESDDYFFNKKDSKDKIFLFRIVGLKNVKSLTISLYGKINYIGCSSNSVSLINENTIAITPVEGVANIDSQTDTYGNPITNTISCFFGYVVYSEYMSPSILSIIILGSLFGVAIIVLLVLMFKKRGLEAQNSSEINEEDKKTNKNLFYCVSIGIKDVFKSKTAKLIKRQWILYAIILPAVVLLFIFNYLPLGGILIAFKDYNVSEGIWESEWIGLKSFRMIFLEPTSTYYLAIRNTIYISMLRIVTNFPPILIFALLLNEIKHKKLRGVVQTISYIPHFISWVAVGSLTSNLFSTDGLFNIIIEKCGGTPISWYTNTEPWWAILSATSLWKGMGWSTLIYLSAMVTIDEELYDACLIDGGGKFRQAIVVTIPGISNVIVLQLLLDVASILGDNAEQILALTNGNTDSLNSVHVIGTGIIGTITGGGSYTNSTAIGLFQSVVGFILVFVMNKIVKKSEHEGII